MRLLKRIFLSIFGFICLLGLLNVGLQYIFPVNKAQKNVAASDMSWKTFTNEKYHYSISYPGYLTLTETPYTAVFQEEQGQFARPDFPSMYISVIPDGFTNAKDVYNFMSEDVVNRLFSAQDNESVPTVTGEDSQYWIFTRIASFPVSGVDGIIIQNNNVQHGEGVINRRILARKNGFTYIIGSFYSTQEELDAFYKFLVSFTFLQ